MGKDLLDGARTTKNAPRVQDAHPTRTPPRSEGDMSLEEFMRRNPSARNRDKVKTAQVDQGKRSGPSTRATTRSKRKNPRKPRATQSARDMAARVEQKVLENPNPNKWNINKVKVGGDQVDFLTPTNPDVGAGPSGGRPRTKFVGRAQMPGEDDTDYAIDQERVRLKGMENSFRRMQRGLDLWQDEN